jgi:hypothetical protein
LDVRSYLASFISCPHHFARRVCSRLLLRRREQNS